MATYTAASGGGNWNAGATWSSASYPVAGDTAIIASTSGVVTVNVNSACTTLTIQAAKLITMNANLAVSGVVTFTGADIINGTGILTISGGITIGSKGSISGTSTISLAGNMTLPAMTFGCNLTLTSGTITWGAVTNSFSKVVTYVGGTMSFNAAHVASFANGSTIATSGMTWKKAVTAGTVTLTANLLTETLDFIQPTTWAGNFDITVTNFRMGATATTVMTSSVVSSFVAGRTLTVSTSFEIYGNYPYTLTMQSTSAGTAYNIVYSGTDANCKIHNAVLTDLNVTGVLRAVFSTQSGCTNVKLLQNSDILRAGATLCHLN
jgi:hypothetical protein